MKWQRFLNDYYYFKVNKMGVIIYDFADGGDSVSGTNDNRTLIEQFGQAILEIGSIFGGKISFPLDVVSAGSVAEGLDSILNSQVIEEIKDISKQIETLNNGNQSRDNLSLAARCFHHDSNNLYSHIYFSYHNVRMKLRTLEGNPHMLEKPSFVNGLYSDIEHFRLLALSIAYLASGGTDARFLAHVDSSQLEYLLGRKRDSEFSLIRRGIRQSGLIPSTVYFAVHQLAKNSKSDYKTDYKESTGHGVLSIQDEGPGLLDRETKGHLPADRIHEIFLEYTTKSKNGGLGLQVAKRLMELSHGWIGVISRAGDGNVYSYSTSTGKLECLGPMPGYKGAGFRLYFPRVAK